MVRSAHWYDQASVTGVFAAVAILALLALPVSYRGGADVPHPHASIQLWLDAAHGSTDHHRRFDVDHTDHQAYDQPHAGVGTVRSAPDVPTVSEMVAHELPSAIAISVMAWAALAVWKLAAGWSVTAALRGQAPRPETPPPREPIVST